MKRIILTSYFISLSGLSSFATAEVTSQQMINQTLVSNPKFELTIGSLLLQPSSSALDYAVLGYPLPVQTPTGESAL